MKRFSVLFCFVFIVAPETFPEELTTGEKFHRDTSLTFSGLFGPILKWQKKPLPFKEYQGTKKIKLPEPGAGGKTLHEVLSKRRSKRRYSGAPLALGDLSNLLWAASGITGKGSGGILLRTAPSGGALYPIEIYLAVRNVINLPKGIYHYSVRDHSLELLKEGDFHREIRKAAIDQEFVEEASVVFVLSASFPRITWKYSERGFRYAYLEAGHVSQNIYLEATALGLGTCAVGAFYDFKVNGLLGLDGIKEAALYLQTVGVK